MFEQSIMTGAKPRPWTFSVSTAMQGLLVGVAVLVPLITVEALPPVKLDCHFCLPPSNVKIVAVKRMSGGTARPGTLTTPVRAGVRVLTAPGAIPRVTPQLFDDDPGTAFTRAGEAAVGSDRGVPDGFSIGKPGESLIGVATAQPQPPAPKPAAAPVAREPIRVGGRVQQPMLIHEVRPPYPPLARQARVSGSVKMEAILARDGTVQSLRLLSGPPLLTQAAMTAVSQWRYRPTLLNGEPVEILLSIDVNFTLTQ